MALGTIEDKSGFFGASDSFHRGFAGVGGQVGHNWQFGSTVLGTEANWNWNRLHYTGVMGGDEGVEGSTSLRLSQFGSVRARAGLAFERTLAYVTAGPAWGRLQGSVTSICQNARGCEAHSLASWSSDSWQWGALAGAGVEFVIARNLSLRAEYVALALTDRTVSPSSIVQASNGIDCVGGMFNGAPATRQCPMSFQVSEQIAWIALNYKFGGLVAPVTK